MIKLNNNMFNVLLKKSRLSVRKNVKLKFWYSNDCSNINTIGVLVIRLKVGQSTNPNLRVFSGEQAIKRVHSIASVHQQPLTHGVGGRGATRRVYAGPSRVRCGVQRGGRVRLQRCGAVQVFSQLAVGVQHAHGLRWGGWRWVING